MKPNQNKDLQNTTFNDLLLESTDLKMHSNKCHLNNHKEGGHNYTGCSWKVCIKMLNTENYFCNKLYFPRMAATISPVPYVLWMWPPLRGGVYDLGWTLVTALTKWLWPKWHGGPCGHNVEKAPQLLPGFLEALALAVMHCPLSELSLSMERSIRRRAEASSPQPRWAPSQ